MKADRELEIEPWYAVFSRIRQRINDPNHPSYKNYGGRGIKLEITVQELKELWFRDKAGELDCASIDRIDINGDYKLSNCRFIERRENSRVRRNTQRPSCKHGHPYTENNIYIHNSGGWRARVCRICRQNWRDNYNKKMRLRQWKN